MVESSGQQKKESASIASKIEKEFEELKIEGEEELDLLEMMDN